MPPDRSLSSHRLGPRDMPVVAKRSRNVAVAIPELRAYHLLTGSQLFPNSNSP